MSEDSDVTLICMPLELMPETPVPSRKARCDVCGCAIWVSLRAPRATNYNCMPCAEALVDSAAEFLPLTEEQLKDVQEWSRKKFS